jgi:hypothetical protein
MANVTAAIQHLISIFTPLCAESSTLGELSELIQDRSRWRTARDLFERIRKKALAAQKSGDQLLQAQYEFEEACAKTVYNLSGETAPFDSYVPFSIVPNAFALARRLDIGDSEIVLAIMS